LQFAELRARFEQQMAEHLAAVGRRLREARERNRPDLTSHEKAAHELSKAGVIVTGKQYGRWERGESEARSDKREAIASMLGTTVEALWGEPPIAPEVELRQQLGRIEQKLDLVLDAMGISPSGAAEAAEAAGRASAKPQGSSSRKPSATPKKRANG
jgi:hypothetical protein